MRKEIQHEFITADSPEYNNVAEQGLTMTESATLAARTQPPELFPGCSVPEIISSWAEAAEWASDAYSQTATAANPVSRSPYGMLNGEVF